MKPENNSSDFEIYFKASALGAVAGLRAMTAPALLSYFASNRENNEFENNPPSSRKGSVVLGLLAAGELVGDKLPFTPNRTGAPGLDGMAGGSAYPRACSTMLWLHNLNKETETAVWEMGKVVMRKHYLMVQVRKCRSGKGLNSEFAFNIDTKTLRLKELGMVAPNGQIVEPEYAVKDIVGAKAPAETFESVLHKAHDVDAIKAPADAPKTDVTAPVIPNFSQERSFEQKLDIAF